MSTQPPPPAGQGPDRPETDDILAAEYVLGLLDGPEWRAARDRALVDAGFSARVAAWEARLAPLNADFEELPAPDLLPQITAQLFPARPRPRPRHRGAWFVGLVTGSGLAAAMLAALVILFVPLAPTGPVFQAELSDEAGALVLQITYAQAEARLQVTATGRAPGADQDFELWAIDAATGVPRSLGLLTGALTELVAELDPDTVLAVSLEPAGGSPEAGPTGPVLAAGPLTEA
ncbi:MAG: anti-sigma factor [Roseinatronobacter sp.]